MSLDPKVAKLAQELAGLLKCYAPDLSDDGHAAIELFESFRAGLAVSPKIHTIALPFRTQPDVMAKFDIDAPLTIKITIANNSLRVGPCFEPTADTDTLHRMNGCAVYVNFKEDAMLLNWGQPRNHRDPVELKIP